MKKTLTVIAIALLIVIMLVGCTESAPVQSAAGSSAPAASEASAAPETSAAPAAPENDGLGKKPLVGVCVEVLADNPYQVSMGNAFKSSLEAMGYEYLFDAPQQLGDFTQQISIIEGFMNKGCEVLIFAPSNFPSMMPVITSAKEKGVSVVLIDDEAGQNAQETEQYKKELGFATVVTPNSEVDAYNGTKYLIEKMGGKGKILNLEGAPGFTVAEQRRLGFERAAAEYPGIQVVASQTGEWTEEGGLKVTENILTAHPDLGGVFCANDGMAYGAIEALKAKGVKAFVVGIDADERALELVKSGEYTATVGASFNRLADWAVRVALAQHYFIKNGIASVEGDAFQPFIAKLNSGAVIVDSANLDDFIEKER